MSELYDLKKQIYELERRTERSSRRTRVTILATIGLLCLSASTETSKHLVVEKLEVVDSRGQVRMRMGMYDKSPFPELSLFAPDGERLIHIAAGYSFSGRGPGGQGVSKIQVVSSGGTAELVSSSGGRHNIAKGAALYLRTRENYILARATEPTIHMKHDNTVVWKAVPDS